MELDRKEASALAARSKSNSASPTGSGSLPLKPMAPTVHPLPAKPINAATYSRTQSRQGSQPSSSRPGSQAQSRNGSSGSQSVSPPMSQSSKLPLPPVASSSDAKHSSSEAKPVPASVKRGTDYKIPKKDSSQKTVIGRQLDKYRAEKRAASLPNSKSENGSTPPRVPSSHASGSSKLAAGSSTINARDRSDSDGTEKTASRRPAKRSQTPSDDEDAERPRKLTAAERRRVSKKPSPDYSSSTDEDAHRGRQPVKRSTPPARSSQPTTTKASSPQRSPVFAKGKYDRNGSFDGKTNGHTSPTASALVPPKSPESMRERYEELYPAYQQLARKLTAIYQDCEDVEVEGRLSNSTEEVAKMAARWKKWHAELAEIRQWFDVES